MNLHLLLTLLGEFSFVETYHVIYLADMIKKKADCSEDASCTNLSMCANSSSNQNQRAKVLDRVLQSFLNVLRTFLFGSSGNGKQDVWGINGEKKVIHFVISD